MNDKTQVAKVYTFGNGWTGKTTYVGHYGNHFCFRSDDFHSLFHAKRELLWMIMARGINITMGEIVHESETGTMS